MSSLWNQYDELRKEIEVKIEPGVMQVISKQCSRKLGLGTITALDSCLPLA